MTAAVAALQVDEVAVFAYGGSIMTTIFGHGAITFDADLVTHSRNNAETVVSYGSSLGRATGRPHTHAPAGAQQWMGPMDWVSCVRHVVHVR